MHGDVVGAEGGLTADVLAAFDTEPHTELAPVNAEEELSAGEAEGGHTADVLAADTELDTELAALNAQEFSAGEAQSLLEAFSDVKLCDHFLSEPALSVGGTARLVRVGLPGEGVCGIRSRSVGTFSYKNYRVVWAVEKDEIFARYVDHDGVWSPILEARTANALGRAFLDSIGSKTSKISAPKFFGVHYFKNLGSKRHTFPKSDESGTCFTCGEIIRGRHRYHLITLARLCDSSRCKKRKAAVLDDDGGTISVPFCAPESLLTKGFPDVIHQTKVKLFAAAIISTGLTFHAVHELFLRAQMEMPLREDQFYQYQKSFITFIGGYAKFDVFEFFRIMQS